MEHHDYLLQGDTAAGGTSCDRARFYAAIAPDDELSALEEKRLRNPEFRTW